MKSKFKSYHEKKSLNIFFSNLIYLDLVKNTYYWFVTFLTLCSSLFLQSIHSLYSFLFFFLHIKILNSFVSIFRHSKSSRDCFVYFQQFKFLFKRLHTFFLLNYKSYLKISNWRTWRFNKYSKYTNLFLFLSRYIFDLFYLCEEVSMSILSWIVWVFVYKLNHHRDR